MKILTNVEAVTTAGKFFETLTLSADKLKPYLNEAALREFNNGISTGHALCRGPATRETCQKIEKCLSTLMNLFLNSLEAESKIKIDDIASFVRWQGVTEQEKEAIMLILDCFNIAGNACFTAIHGRLPYDA
jgi:hypothetical protein